MSVLSSGGRNDHLTQVAYLFYNILMLSNRQGFIQEISHGGGGGGGGISTVNKTDEEGIKASMHIEGVLDILKQSNHRVRPEFSHLILTSQG